MAQCLHSQRASCLKTTAVLPAATQVTQAAHPSTMVCLQPSYIPCELINSSHASAGLPCLCCAQLGSVSSCVQATWPTLYDQPAACTLPDSLLSHAAAITQHRALEHKAGTLVGGPCNVGYVHWIQMPAVGLSWLTDADGMGTRWDWAGGSACICVGMS
jgi:hypothetical protein